MGSSDATRIRVQGMDLMQDIMGKLNLGDFAFLEIQKRLPTPAESIVFNAMLATLVEHGMTPMVIAARLTYLGAPESLQGAVAAGLLGMGTTFAGTAEGAARMLYAGLKDASADADIPALAKAIVDRELDARRPIFGIGHNLHKPIDPRTPVLFAIADQQGYRGRYVALIEAVAAAAEARTGKSMPVNATGALGALCCELGLDWRLCRGLAVIGRSVGLVGHIAEELRNPIAKQIWMRTEEEIARSVAIADAKQEQNA